MSTDTTLEQPVAVANHWFGRNRAIWLAVAVAAIVHFPILLSDTILWDSCVVANAHAERDFSLLKEIFTVQGSPLGAHLHYCVGQLPHPLFAYRAISFICILVATACICAIVRQVPFFGDREAFAVAALAAAFPFYSVWQELIMLPYSIAYASFYLAALIYLNALRSPITKSVLLKVAAGALFFFSFMVQSLLVAFYVIVLLFSFVIAGRKGIAAYVRFYAAQAGMLLLPPAYFIARQIAFPVQEVYEGYNPIEPSAYKLFKLFVVAPKRIAIDQARETIQLIVDHPGSFAFLAVLGIGLLLPVFASFRKITTRPLSRGEFWGTLAFAVFAFYAAIFPYAVVGKFPIIGTFSCRHALVAIVPVALGIVVISRHLLTARAFSVVVGVLLVIGFAQQAWNQVRWQNRFVKFQGVVEALRNRPEIPPGVVVVRDLSPLGKPESLRGYEVNWLLKQAYGNERHLGLGGGEVSEERFQQLSRSGVQRIYMSRDFQETGVNTLLEILPTQTESELMCYWKYLSLGGSAREKWLAGLVPISVKPIKLDFQNREPQNGSSHRDAA